MITDIKIKNFKSIEDLSIPLGAVNVFIGANGTGKSNILEAVAMVASENSSRIEIKEMLQKGVRIARPDLMINSFYGKTGCNHISVEVTYERRSFWYELWNDTLEDIYSVWNCTVNQTGKPDAIEASMKSYLSQYLVYAFSVDALRGLTSDSLQYPLGIHGEGLDVLLNNLPQDEINQIKETLVEYIPWLEDFMLDEADINKMNGYKLGRSMSRLYFKDKFMQAKNNIFSSENVNEGTLSLLGYLTLFISRKTPSFFAIDNIETGLNPRLCRYLMKTIGELAVKNSKQALITTHNPAVLDGLNLNDDNQRLYVVSRNDKGYTCAKRIKAKPETAMPMKLSEMWMNGLLGGVPDNF
jgi:AAA15 family ATPase/GTPase